MVLTHKRLHHARGKRSNVPACSAALYGEGILAK